MNRFPQLTVFVGMILVTALTVFSQGGQSPYQLLHGAVVRADVSRPELALVFTGDEYADGGFHIASVLASRAVKASFFFTGKFYRNPEFKPLIQTLIKEGHYMGGHSDQHLLYCSWENRDSLLVSQKQFSDDLRRNYKVMEAYGITKKDAQFFLPPYEWYNDSIALWTRAEGLTLVNHSFGTLSHADYTTPGNGNYRSSMEIFQSILDYEISHSDGLNGFILLIHIGTEATRTDKFYLFLDELIGELDARAYDFRRIDELLSKK